MTEPRTKSGRRLAKERDACLGVQCKHADDAAILAIEDEAREGYVLLDSIPPDMTDYMAGYRQARADLAARLRARVSSLSWEDCGHGGEHWSVVSALIDELAIRKEAER